MCENLSGYLSNMTTSGEVRSSIKPVHYIGGSVNMARISISLYQRRLEGMRQRFCAKKLRRYTKFRISRQSDPYFIGGCVLALIFLLLWGRCPSSVKVRRVHTGAFSNVVSGTWWVHHSHESSTVVVVSKTTSLHLSVIGTRTGQYCDVIDLIESVYCFTTTAWYI